MSRPTKRKRACRFVILVLLLCCAGAGIVWAFVSASANISKENSYAVVKAQSGSAATSKENSYAAMGPPVVTANTSKFNTYAVLQGASHLIQGKCLRAYNSEFTYPDVDEHSDRNGDSDSHRERDTYRDSHRNGNADCN